MNHSDQHWIQFEVPMPFVQSIKGRLPGAVISGRQRTNDGRIAIKVAYQHHYYEEVVGHLLDYIAYQVELARHFEKMIELAKKAQPANCTYASVFRYSLLEPRHRASLPEDLVRDFDLAYPPAAPPDVLWVPSPNAEIPHFVHLCRCTQCGKRVFFWQNREYSA